jgi:hypothetical protein
MINKIKFFLGRKIRDLIFTCGIPYSYYIDYILQSLKYSNWIKKNKYMLLKNFYERDDLYIFLNEKIIKNQPIDYLEFGVADGTSFRQWLSLNNHSSSKFYGFDTFTGLPENYSNPLYNLKKGEFSQNGKIPKIKDKRHKFFKGLIQKTLPIFLKKFKPRKYLIVNVDVDLYSSTLFILSMLEKILIKKNIFIFDEFATGIHEFRAFMDYKDSFKRTYELVASSNNYSRVSLKIK